ncbi:DNA repair and recombination protein RadA, partial [Candidatus Bathyarchaeota archaeon]
MELEQILITDLKEVESTIVSKLGEAGFISIESIAITPMNELMEKTGISNETAAKLLHKVRDIIGLEYITALEFYKKKQNAQRLTTGSNNLDRLLGGGIEMRAITEFIGEFGAGKSQICMQLCVTSQKPLEQGGLGGKVLFIDTEGTFSPQRIHDIAEARDLEPRKILENIIYVRCYNSDHQIFIVNKAAKVIEAEKIKLIVVDSIIGHFRGEYVGKEMLIKRQQLLNQHIHRLLRLAELYNCSVVITNQIQSNPSAFVFGDPNRPAGGNVVAHASTHRLYIRKSKKNIRVIQVIDSPYLPE